MAADHTDTNRVHLVLDGGDVTELVRMKATPA